MSPQAPKPGGARLFLLYLTMSLIVGFGISDTIPALRNEPTLSQFFKGPICLPSPVFALSSVWRQ